MFWDRNEESALWLEDLEAACSCWGMVALCKHNFWFTSVGLASIIRLCNTCKVWNGWTDCLEHWVNVKLCCQFGQLTLKYLQCFWYYVCVCVCVCMCKNNTLFRDVSVTLRFDGRCLNWKAISAMNIVQHCPTRTVFIGWSMLCRLSLDGRQECRRGCQNYSS